MYDYNQFENQYVNQDSINPCPQISTQANYPYSECINSYSNQLHLGYYQYPNSYYGEYDYKNSAYPYSYSNDYYRQFYPESQLSTSNLDSTGNSLNSSNTQLSPIRSDNSEVSFSNYNFYQNTRKCNTRKQQLPDHAVDIMNDWFTDHINNPYPTLEDKERLAKEGSITVKQVTAWFSNRRNRSQNTKPKRIKRAIEYQMNEIINELSYNTDKTQIIEKFKKTIMNQ